jgi:hypothetical protein
MFGRERLAMYLLYTDETNLDARSSEFFVYGGIAIPSENAKSLSDALVKIREAAKIKPEFLLKSNHRPEHLDAQAFIKIKNDFVDAAANAKCVFLTSIILHKIAINPDEARRNEINRILFHFDCFLIRPKTEGVVLIDRFSDKQIDTLVRERTAVGVIDMPYSKSLELKRILGIHYSAIGQSHFCSLIDILLGMYRYAIDAALNGGEKGQEVAKSIIKRMQPLFFCEREDGKISEFSINFSPKIIKGSKYRVRYQELKNFFIECGVVPHQEITEHRQY